MDAQTHAETTSIFSWLKPDKNPFYLITIAAVFTLSFSAYQQYEQSNWDFLFYLVGFIIFINLGLSLVPQEIEDEQYEKNLRFARSFGIAIATLSLVFLRDVLHNIPNTTILYLILIQVIVFSFFLFMGILKKSNVNYTGRKKINNFQLCLTTSSLLIGIIVNYNGPLDNLKTVVTHPMNYADEAAQAEAAASAATESNLPADTAPAMSEQENNGNVEQERNLNNQKAEEIVFTSKKECQHSVFKLLLYAWIICMLAWLYQLRGVLNIKFNFDNPLD